MEGAAVDLEAPVMEGLRLAVGRVLGSGESRLRACFFYLSKILKVY